MTVHRYDNERAVYIELRPEPAADSWELVPGIVVDVTATGEVVGLDLDLASPDAPRLLAQMWAGRVVLAGPAGGS